MPRWVRTVLLAGLPAFAVVWLLVGREVGSEQAWHAAAYFLLFWFAFDVYLWIRNRREDRDRA